MRNNTKEKDRCRSAFHPLEPAQSSCGPPPSYPKKHLRPHGKHLPKSGNNSIEKSIKKEYTPGKPDGTIKFN